MILYIIVKGLRCNLYRIYAETKRNWNIIEINIEVDTVKNFSLLLQQYISRTIMSDNFSFHLVVSNYRQLAQAKEEMTWNIFLDLQRTYPYKIKILALSKEKYCMWIYASHTQIKWVLFGFYILKRPESKDIYWCPNAFKTQTHNLPKYSFSVFMGECANNSEERQAPCSVPWTHSCPALVAINYFFSCLACQQGTQEEIRVLVDAQIQFW